MKRVKPHNYIVIHGWMLEAGLTGRELLAFALIYGFTQDGVNRFSGSAEYISEWLCCSRRHVFRIMDSLVDKGMLEKRTEYIDGVPYTDYWWSGGSDKMSPPSDKMSLGVVTKCHHPSDKMSPNNIDYNISILSHTDKEIIDTLNIDGAWRYNTSARMAVVKRLADFVRGCTPITEDVSEPIAVALENNIPPERVIIAARKSADYMQFAAALLGGG